MILIGGCVDRDCACAGAWTCSATGSGYEPSGSTWGELGVPVELLVEENWWSNGPTGPCGPDSEIFVWTGDGPPPGTRPGHRWSAGCSSQLMISSGARSLGGQHHRVAKDLADRSDYHLL